MTLHRRNLACLTTLLSLGLLVLPVGLTGCGKEESKKPQQTYIPPPPPPLAPLEGLEMDPRVQFPQSREPSSRDLAEGIAQLASSLVSGDEASMAEMLDENGNMVLNALVDSGQWKKESEEIEAVRVCVLSEGENGATCQLGLGVQDRNGAYLLAWSGRRTGDTWVFSPEPLEATEGEQLAALDNASIVAPTLPSPVRLEVDPESMKLRPIERFSK